MSVQTMIFTIYSKAGCPYCEMIKQILIGKDLSFTEYVLDVDFSRQQFINEFGNTAYPQIVMDGKKLGGCTDTVKYLREQKII